MGVSTMQLMYHLYEVCLCTRCILLCFLLLTPFLCVLTRMVTCLVLESVLILVRPLELR